MAEEEDGRNQLCLWLKLQAPAVDLSLRRDAFTEGPCCCPLVLSYIDYTIMARQPPGRLKAANADFV